MFSFVFKIYNFYYKKININIFRLKSKNLEFQNKIKKNDYLTKISNNQKNLFSSIFKHVKKLLKMLWIW